MKKNLLAGAAGVALAMLCGCTSVESTQKFNAMKIAGPNEQAVCYTRVDISGFYLFGLPIVVGSAAEDGKCAMFINTLKAEHAVALLTREAKRHGANKVINLSTVNTGGTLSPIFFCSFYHFQASGIGVRPAASKPSQPMPQSYDMQ